MTSREIQINHTLAIPLRELTFRASRSSGPGGQHVNKTETKVELIFDVGHSASLSDRQREILRERLASRLDTRGLLHVVASQERSQLQNKSLAIAEFARLLAAALKPRKRRVPTKPTVGAVERRIATKKKRSATKRLRSGSGDE